MGKYDIEDAKKLKEAMMIISEMNTKYEYVNSRLENVPEDIKQLIEFIQEMVESGV